MVVQTFWQLSGPFSKSGVKGVILGEGEKKYGVTHLEKIIFFDSIFINLLMISSESPGPQDSSDIFFFDVGQKLTELRAFEIC